MADLNEIVVFCDERVRRSEIKDFKGAENGLQMANSGKVKKIGAAVDAGLVPFQKAAEAGVDFLIVHHGMFWNPLTSISGVAYDKVKCLFENDLAVYSSHLPLDLHPEIGNNAILASKLGLEGVDHFLPYEGNHFGFIGRSSVSRDMLHGKLKALFPQGVTAIEFGSKAPERVAILTGSGQSAVSELKAAGVDTFITGELKQNHFNYAQEEGLNLYLCGHYATEVFGVQALAAEVSERFGVEWEFIETECPL